jgi:hypothetical protein
MKKFVIIWRAQCENNPALWPLVEHRWWSGSDSVQIAEDDPDLVEILLRADSVVWAAELEPGEKRDPAFKGFQRIVGNISQ